MTTPKFNDYIKESFSVEINPGHMPNEIDYNLWKNQEVPASLYMKDKVGIPISKKTEVPEYNILPTMKDDFLKKLVWICKDLEIDPDWMMALIFFESRFNPRAKNSLSNAKGLIQWLPSTLQSNYGITTTQLTENPLKQLDMVYAYFKNRLKNNKPNSLLDFYLMVFYPKAVNKPGNFKFGEKAISSNKGLFGYYKDEKFGTKADFEAMIFKNDKISVFANLAKRSGDFEKYAYGGKGYSDPKSQEKTEPIAQVKNLKSYSKALSNGSLELA